MSSGICAKPQGCHHARRGLLPSPRLLFCAGLVMLVVEGVARAEKIDCPVMSRDLQQLYTLAEKAFADQQWARSKALFGQVLGRSYWERGRLRRRLGRTREAVDDLEWARQVDPGDLEIRLELAQAYLANEQFALAVRALEEGRGGGKMTAEAFATLGRAYFSLGRHDVARRHFERALALQPTDHLTAYALAALLLAQRQRAEAQRLFARLRQAVGDSAGFRLLVGRAYLETGFHREGEAHLRRALELDPRIHYAHHLLGLSALQQDETGGMDEARREFEAEVANHPGEFAPLFMLGVVLEMKREWSQAKTHLLRALQLEPADPDVYFYLGRVRLESGEIPEAVQDLERSIALTSDKSRGHFQIARARFLLSRAYRALGQTEKSSEEAERARRLSRELANWEKARMTNYLSLEASVEKLTRQGRFVTWQELESSDPRDPRWTDLERLFTQVLANSHHRLGLLAAQGGDFEEAVRQFGRLAQIQPDFPKVDFNLGLVAFRARRLPEAIAALRRAVAREPYDVAVRDLLGRAEFEAGDCESAMPNLQSAGSTLPDDPGRLLALGTCLARARRTTEAEQVFSRLLASHSQLPELHVFLGRAAHAQGRFTEAEAELQEALKRDPQTRQAHFYLGIMALDRGDVAGAAREFEAEVRLDPDDHKARYHLAYAMLLEGKRVPAIRLLEEIVEAAPGYAEARYTLGKALVEQGKLRRGILELEAAVHLDPNKAHAHYQLGRAYLKAGRTAEGRRGLERARELKKGHSKPPAEAGTDSGP